MPRATFRDCATTAELMAGATLVRDTWVFLPKPGDPAPSCPACGAPLFIDDTTENAAGTPVWAAGCTGCEFVHVFPVR